MKLTTGILLLGMATGAAWAQNPDIIQDTRSTLQNIQKKQTIDQNAALAASGQAPNSSTPNKPSAAVAPAKPVANQSASAPTQAKPAAKPATISVSAPAKAKPAAKPATSSASAPAKAKPVVKPATSSASAPAKAKPVVKPATSSASAPAKVKPAAQNHKAPAANAPKTATAKSKKKSTTIAVKPPAEPKQAVAVEDKKNPLEPKKEEETKTYSAAGRRDPFVSPVVNRSMLGSGCSTGKRCLAIDQINLQGVVKSESGMIAVVVNALNKAYFLHENDPVFNGYVVKITGYSIIFKETIQDKLGKPFEREVTKKISTPAV